MRIRVLPCLSSRRCDDGERQRSGGTRSSASWLLPGGSPPCPRPARDRNCRRLALAGSPRPGDDYRGRPALSSGPAGFSRHPRRSQPVIHPAHFARRCRRTAVRHWVGHFLGGNWQRRRGDRRVSHGTLRQFGPHRSRPRRPPSVDPGADRAWRLACRGDAAADPSHPAQPRQLWTRTDTADAWCLRVRIADWPTADDDRLCRAGSGRAAIGARWPALAQANSDRPLRAVFVPPDPRLYSLAGAITSLQRFWRRTTSGPVEKLDGVDNRDGTTAGELADAADVAGCDEVRSGGGDVGQLAIAQHRRDFWLQYVVGSGR